MDPIFIPIIAIVCGTIVALVAVLRIKGSKGGTSAEDEMETRTIQQLYEQCNHLADRIEALETIILEHEKTKDS